MTRYKCKKFDKKNIKKDLCHISILNFSFFLAVKDPSYFYPVFLLPAVMILKSNKELIVVKKNTVF